MSRSCQSGGLKWPRRCSPLDVATCTYEFGILTSDRLTPFSAFQGQAMKRAGRFQSLTPLHTTRHGAPARNNGSSNCVKWKCPTWFVPKVSSNPSLVYCGLAPKPGYTPAFKMSRRTACLAAWLALLLMHSIKQHAHSPRHIQHGEHDKRSRCNSM